MRSKLTAFARQQDLFRPGDRILCAVSGGPDSMALLAALRGLDLRLRVLHCHHHLRGADADADAALVRDYCQTYHIPMELVHLDVTGCQAATGQSLEEAARTLRYQALETARQPDEVIATAHNAQDNLETSLIRLVRGTSPRGLAGIPVRQGSIIRPLLFADRAEILAFLDREQVPYRLDATNETDFCLRNRIRRQIIPLLLQENPNLLTAWLQTGQQLRQEDAYLSELARSAAVEVAYPHPTPSPAPTTPCTGGALSRPHPTPDPIPLSITALTAQPAVLRPRILFHYLEQWGVDQPQQRHLQALEALVNGHGAIDLPGMRLRRTGDTIAPDPARTRPIPPTPVELGITQLPGWRITCQWAENPKKNPENPTIFPIRYDMIADGGLTVRTGRPQDRFPVPNGRRSLKRLCMDHRIPPERRDRLIVLCHGDRVIAIPGIGLDPAYRWTDGPCLQIKTESEA